MQRLHVSDLKSSGNKVTKRSIGEVLALLKQEFGDITISKIRFLESQGLVNPERTSSGYRKFSEDDVTRLRYILREQKEHFLPLKVIRGRLEQPATSDNGEGVAVQSPDVVNVREDVAAASLLGGATLDRGELINASSLTESQLRELEGYGLINGRRTAEGVWYDENALVIAKLASRLLQHGTEVRHLRIYKTAADREADLYRQLTVQVRGARNTTAKMEAQARLQELTTLGEAMRRELLRQAISSS